VQSVFDQGSSWTFRFSTQDRDLGTVTMSRAELEAAGWLVHVPDGYGQTLTRAGLPPTP